MSHAHREPCAKVVDLYATDALFNEALKRGDRDVQNQYARHREQIISDTLDGIVAATGVDENEEYWRNNPTCPPAVRSHMECPMCGEHAVQQHLFAVADAGAWACSECTAAGPAGTYWPLLRAKKGIK